MHDIPARAAYAAAEAPAFPDESSTKWEAPIARATLTRMDMPRSLYEPVGLAPSSFA